MVIADLRKARGLTQEELARRVRVSTRTIAAWESGSTTPRQRSLRALARALHVSVNDLQPSDDNGSTVET